MIRIYCVENSFNTLCKKKRHTLGDSTGYVSDYENVVLPNETLILTSNKFLVEQQLKQTFFFLTTQGKFTEMDQRGTEKILKLSKVG